MPLKKSCHDCAHAVPSPPGRGFVLRCGHEATMPHGVMLLTAWEARNLPRPWLVLRMLGMADVCGPEARYFEGRVTPEQAAERASQDHSSGEHVG